MNTKQFGNSSFGLEEEKLDLVHEVKRYIRFWPWFLLSILFSISVAFIYLRYAQRIYKTLSLIHI